MKNVACRNKDERVEELRFMEADRRLRWGATKMSKKDFTIDDQDWILSKDGPPT